QDNALMQCVTDFFNHIRSRVMLNEHILGYFWTSLKVSASDEKYIRIHLYISNGKFNNRMTDEIKSVWNSILFKNQLEGKILFLTQTKDSYKGGYESLLFWTKDANKGRSRNNLTPINNEPSDEQKTEKYVRSVQRDKTSMLCILYPDWNDDTIFHHFTNEMNAIQFKGYLFRLAKQTYQQPKVRSIGVACINSMKAKRHKKK
ncbi:hypothetical protein, partial [Providencia sp. PROV193]